MLLAGVKAKVMRMLIIALYSFGMLQIGVIWYICDVKEDATCRCEPWGVSHLSDS